jgi:hypothetical protein
MKIAICFSGGIRSFLTCYPSIYKNLILPLNADIFFHLWSQPFFNKYDLSFNSFKFQEDECNQEKVYEILNKENKVKDFVIDEFSPDWQDYIIKKCIDPAILDKFNSKDKDYAISAICMYYKIYAANNLKKNFEEHNNFKYDIVIRARLDFLWHTKFNLDDFICDNNQIILVKDSYCTKAKWMGNDKFFASTSLNMDKICDLFNLINYFHINLNIPLEGQHLNRFLINHLNLNIKFIGDQYTYEKILASKRIRLNGLVCFVYDCFDDFGYFISEDFLKRGYKVYGLSNNINQRFNILNKYDHFELVFNTDKIFSSYFVFTKQHDFIDKIIPKRVIYFVDNNFDITLQKEQIKNYIFVDSFISIESNIKNLTKIFLDKNNCQNFILSKLNF